MLTVPYVPTASCRRAEQTKHLSFRAGASDNPEDDGDDGKNRRRQTIRLFLSRFLPSSAFRTFAFARIHTQQLYFTRLSHAAAVSFIT